MTVATPCPVHGEQHVCRRRHRSKATSYAHLCLCGYAFNANPYVVWCTTCPRCNGWGMLYDGKARPKAAT